MGRWIRYASIGVVLVLALGACGDDGGENDSGATDEPSEPAETADRAEPSDAGDQGGQLAVQGLQPLMGDDELGTNTGDTGSSGGSTGDGGAYDTIRDQDGYLEVSVPTDWSDRQGGSPGFSDDDGANGSGVVLFTSVDVARFQKKWGVPGMSLAATSSPFQIGQVDGLIDANDYADDCESGGAKGPYDDGLYVGKIATYKGCGGTTEFTVIAAQPPDNSYIVLVTVAIPEGEATAADRDEVLDTFRLLRTPPGLI
ncbi:MAG: hypothetical protein ACRDWD_13415 [Acidimicrobiia bacterium]